MQRLKHIVASLLPHWLTFGLLVAIITPPEMVEDGPTICPFKLATGHDCPGCGITRATVHALHGNFSKAQEFHSLVFVILPLVIAGALHQSWRAIRPRNRGTKMQTRPA